MGSGGGGACACHSVCLGSALREGGGCVWVCFREWVREHVACVYLCMCVCGGGGGGEGLTGGGEETLCHYTVSEGVLSQSLLLHCVWGCSVPVCVTALCLRVSYPSLCHCTVSEDVLSQSLSLHCVSGCSVPVSATALCLRVVFCPSLCHCTVSESGVLSQSVTALCLRVVFCPSLCHCTVSEGVLNCSSTSDGGVLPMSDARASPSLRYIYLTEVFY